MFASFWKPSDKPATALPAPDRSIKFKDTEPETKYIDPEITSHLKHFIKHKHDVIQIPVLIAMLYRLWSGEKQPLIKSEIRREDRKIICDVISPNPDIILPEAARHMEVTGYSYIPHLLIPERVKKTISFHDEKTNELFSSKSAPGLATIEVIASILGQTTIKKDCLGFDTERKQFITWDFENAFKQCQKIRAHLCQDIVKLVENPPPRLLEPDPATVIRLTEEKDALDELRRTDNYKQEEWKTIFRILCTPFSQLNSIIHSAISDEKIATMIYNDTVEAIKNAKFKYLQIAEFRNYAFKNWDAFTKEIDTSMQLILDKSYDRTAFVNLCKFLQRYEDMELHILTSSDFAADQKKTLIKNIRIHLFRNSQTINEIHTLAVEVLNKEEFKPVRDLTGPLPFSIKGTHANGQAVSETCGEIIHAAKTCMLYIAFTQFVMSKGRFRGEMDSLVTDDRYIGFLTDQRHSLYPILTDPIFKVIGRRTSSQAMLSELKQANVEDISTRLEDIKTKRAQLCSP